MRLVSARRAVAGRANLPGSTRERDMLHSFSRMLPELLLHSDRTDVRALIAEDLQAAHRPAAVQRDDAPEGEASAHARSALPLAVTTATTTTIATDLWELAELPSMFGLPHGVCDNDPDDPDDLDDPDGVAFGDDAMHEALLDGAGF